MKSMILGFVCVLTLAFPSNTYADEVPATEQRTAVTVASEQPEAQALIGGCETNDPGVNAYAHRVCIVGWNAATPILVVSNDAAKVTYHAELVQHCVRMSTGPDDEVFATCFLDY